MLYFIWSCTLGVIRLACLYKISCDNLVLDSKTRYRVLLLIFFSFSLYLSCIYSKITLQISYCKNKYSLQITVFLLLSLWANTSAFRTPQLVVGTSRNKLWILPAFWKVG